MLFILLLHLFITISTSYKFKPLININNKEVILHLEKFNEKYNLLHIGISFRGYYRNLRYDYRAFNEHRSSITTDINRQDIRLMFPDLNIPNNYIDTTYNEYTETLHNDLDNKYRKDIYWGMTNKTFKEIIDYEKTLNKKYKLGIYDCRHYVHYFTKWCLNNPTPIWRLYELWNEY